VSTEQLIREECQRLSDMLVAKNRAYGDSALDPVGIFARGSAEELIRVRLDDKINRIRNNPEAFGEDPIRDMAGYLILLLIARADARDEASEAAGKEGT